MVKSVMLFIFRFCGLIAEKDALVDANREEEVGRSGTFIWRKDSDEAMESRSKCQLALSSKGAVDMMDRQKPDFTPT